MLFRRRQVWLPTLWGWLVSLALAAALAFAGALNAYDLLATNRPARGPAGDGARTLVVEGWLGGVELQQAVALLRSGHYERVLTTGGPIDPEFDAGGWHSFAVRAATLLREDPAVKVPVIALPAPASAQDRSYLSAVMVRDWAQRSETRLEAIDLLSGGVHARRSRLVYRMALGDEVEVGVFAARPADHDAQRWWTSSTGVKTTVGEALSLGWTACCFWPAPRGSHEERWGVPRATP